MGKVSYQREGKNDKGVRIFITKVKDKVEIEFNSEETIENDHCYLGARPTVNMALIPLCHTRFLKENRMHNYMYNMIKFHTYSDVIMV